MSDPAVQCSIRALGGDPANPNDPVYQFVAKGTAANIQAYFGLTWTSPQVPPQPTGSPNYWVYDVHATTNPGTIATLSQVAANNREPDFFELIQAAIACGSIGTSCNNGSMSSYQANVWEQQKDSQIGVQALQIGANMIDQVSPVNFPTHIVFSTGRQHLLALGCNGPSLPSGRGEHRCRRDRCQSSGSRCGDRRIDFSRRWRRLGDSDIVESQRKLKHAHGPRIFAHCLAHHGI
jgi:hypothetical protein